MPEEIISGCDNLFMSRFWKQLHELTELGPSTTFDSLHDERGSFSIPKMWPLETTLTNPCFTTSKTHRKWWWPFPFKTSWSPSILVNGLEEYWVEHIVDAKRCGKGWRYLIRWTGYDNEAVDQWWHLLLLTAGSFFPMGFLMHLRSFFS